MTNGKVTMSDALAFARANGFGIGLRGAASFAAVLALVALYYAFAPREDSYRQEIVVTLDVEGGKTVYLNGRPFSAADLMSAPVLNRVWCEQKLSERVKFDDFCKCFSLVGYDLERAKLDAEFQAKMSKRNITVTELTALQREYEAKLAAQAANNRYVLAMKPTWATSREEAARVLSSVPSAWHGEYSVLNAPTMPTMMRAGVLDRYVKRLKEGDGRALELVDALRFYRAEIAATCSYVRTKVLRGRNARIDGMDLGAYEAQLDLVRSELLRLKNRLLVEGDPADLEGFVAARLDDMACETMEAEEKAKAVRQTIDMLKDTAGRETDAAAKGESPADRNVTLQADASFFQDFTAMVRREASQESVRKYADELSQYAKELAEIKARKLYYDQIGQYVAKTRARAVTKASKDNLYARTEAFAAEMREIGEKVTEFRDRAMEIYRTQDQFYALPSPVQCAKAFRFSLSRLTLGLLALWALYNLACLFFAWNEAKKC